MKNRQTQTDKILSILRRDGYITNSDCISGVHGFRCLRLGDAIFRLKNKGLIEIDEEKSGYIGDTKNWRYVVKPRKFEPVYVGGLLVSKKWL